MAGAARSAGKRKLYPIEKGERFKCATCQFRYAPRYFKRTLGVLWRFCKGQPAYAVRKSVGFKPISYNTVYYRYDMFRKEIAKFCESNSIPTESDLAGSDPAIYSEFLEFKASWLRRFRSRRPWNNARYQRETEFRFHYRHLKHRELLEILLKMHFSPEP